MPSDEQTFASFLVDMIMPIAGRGPYRSDALIELDVSYHGGAVHVSDLTSYICCAANGVIQPKSFVRFDPGEVRSMHAISFHATFPKGHEDAGKRIELPHKMDGTFDQVYERGLLAEVDLGDFRHIDGLRIHRAATFTVAPTDLSYWRFAVPTRGFQFNVRYPADLLRLTHVSFLSAPHLNIVDNRPGVVRLRYDAWAFPMNGIAWNYSLI